MSAVVAATADGLHVFGRRRRVTLEGEHVNALGSTTASWQWTAAFWRAPIDIHCDIHEVITVAAAPGVMLASTAAGLATSRHAGTRVARGCERPSADPSRTVRRRMMGFVREAR
ncbi:MAG: hypothetical protein ABR529_06275 [Actinomycetota bacterium]